MIERGLRCLQCGAVWQSVPAARVAAARGGCLRCGGELVALADSDQDDARPDKPEPAS
jgi:predicted  nucleic acid-binding Zn-ribbon protein